MSHPDNPYYRPEVGCTVEEITLMGDHLKEVPAVAVTCGRCGHETESFGTGQPSVRRCLVLMREECPRKEGNFYVEDKGAEPAPDNVLFFDPSGRDTPF